MTPSFVEVPYFPGGKRIAVTTSFDDGHTYDRRVVAAFNEWGLKGTFNLNSGKLGRTGKRPGDNERTQIDASEVAELYAGHEVAIHTVSHPHLPQLDATQIVRQVMEDRMALEDLVGYPVRGMAYPFGTYSRQVVEILRSLGIVYCRTTEASAKCFPPQEPLAWPATAHQYSTDPKSVPERFADLYANPRYTGVFYIWGHAFEFADKDDWASLERIYKPLSGKPDVWYCTNIELFDYEAARQRMVIAANRATAYNPSGIPVTLRVDGEFIEALPGQVTRLGK